MLLQSKVVIGDLFHDVFKEKECVQRAAKYFQEVKKKEKEKEKEKGQRKRKKAANDAQKLKTTRQDNT